MPFNDAKEMLDGLSRRLIPYIVNSTDRTSPNTIRLSEFCLAAAQYSDTIYVAALCYVLTHNSSDVMQARPDLKSEAIPSPDQLPGFAQRFARLAETIASSEPLRWNVTSRKILTSDIVTRATEISSLRSEDEKKRQSEWAASEVRAVLPDSSELARIELEIANKVLGGGMVYLDNAAETLLLAKDPAFFCATRVGDLSRPALDTFALFKASGSSEIAHLLAGTITQKARSIRR
jgi:hypothetical protein